MDGNSQKISQGSFSAYSALVDANNPHPLRHAWPKLHEWADKKQVRSAVSRARAGFRRLYEQSHPATRLLLLFCILYAVYIVANSAPVAAGADCGGYLGSAKLLAQGQVSTPIRRAPEYFPATPWAYTPLGYLPREGSDILVPRFPVGLPLQLAFAGRFFGWHWGPLLVQMLGAVLSVIFCYLLLRETRLAPIYSAAGAAAFGTSPLLLSVSYIPLSDAWATAWCTAAMICSFRGRKNPRSAELAGAFMAFAVLVRPTNILIAPAMALAVLAWRPLCHMLLAAAPILIAGAWYNRLLYSNPWATGYGSIGEGFGNEYVFSSLINYTKTMPFVLPLASGCIFLALRPSRLLHHKTAALIVWCLSFSAFYSFYSYTHTHWWYLRFVLPAFPAALGLGMIGWRTLVQRASLLRERRTLILTTLLAVASGFSIYWAVIKKINRSALEQSACAETAQWIQEHLPQETLVACSYLSAAMYYYTELPILRWEYMSPDEFTKVKVALARSGRPLCIALRSFEVKSAFAAMPGDWKQISAEKYFTVWQLRLPEKRTHE